MENDDKHSITFNLMYLLLDITRYIFLLANKQKRLRIAREGGHLKLTVLELIISFFLTTK